MQFLIHVVLNLYVPRLFKNLENEFYAHIKTFILKDPRRSIRCLH